MTRVPAPRVLASLFLAACLVAAVATPAVAQYRPLPAGSYGTADTPLGEPYHIEFAFNLWNPDARVL